MTKCSWAVLLFVRRHSLHVSIIRHWTRRELEEASNHGVLGITQPITQPVYIASGTDSIQMTNPVGRGEHWSTSLFLLHHCCYRDYTTATTLCSCALLGYLTQCYQLGSMGQLSGSQCSWLMRTCYASAGSFRKENRMSGTKGSMLVVTMYRL